MFFIVITKNLNWEIITKNLVTFKRWHGFKDEKCQFAGLTRGLGKKPVLFLRRD